MSEPYRKRMDLISKEIEGVVLDVGCCSGPLHKLLKSLRPDCRIYGIDAKIKDAYKGEKDIVQGDAQNMKMFPPGKFDTVVAGEIIEHLPLPERFVAEAGRVLKPGGKLILTTNNKGALINRLLHNYEAESTTHVHIFTRKELFNLLERNGFKIEKTVMLPYVSSRMAVTDPFRILAHYVLPDSLRENFFMVARKVSPSRTRRIF
jgi:2-polyprenyl-3-methyl-5-hydroxy-6-metoxy-1,4-benzoquinol methylase